MAVTVAEFKADMLPGRRDCKALSGLRHAGAARITCYQAEMASQDHSELEELVARQLAIYTGAHVERAIFPSIEPAAIASAFDSCCRQLLGTGIRAGLFYRASIGAVAGVLLEDGRRAVLKAHQPERSLAQLREIARLQQHLCRAGCFAPAVLGGPAPLGHGHVTIEEYVARGVTRDAHAPAVRRALATSLHALIAALQPFVAASPLSAHLLAQLQPERLWPKPHSKLFDFEATQAGAEDIDALARAARQRMAPAGRLVIGHCDWRAEHVRFEGDVPVAAFDWDSLYKGYEAELVGFIAHAFCADWSRSDCVQAPTLEEARAFVREYEAARGTALDAAERRLCGAAFAYSVAYTARCGFAFGKRESSQPGTFHELLTRHGQGLLDL
jgi:hypothetical protein